MELLKALAMPFQLASLMFVALTSLLLAVVTSMGINTLPLAIPAICLLLVWLTQFAFKLIDDATHGVQETAAASVEMLSPIGDKRCWVHPVLAVVIGTTLLLHPEIPRLPVLVTVTLLFPLSIGAMAISGFARDALNPVALANVLRGLAHYYLLAVLCVAACLALGVTVVRFVNPGIVYFAVLQLLVLVVYAFIGGAVYLRRIELGFEPRVSPERIEQRIEQERIAQRQRMIDGLYTDLRVREPARAVASAHKWLEQTSTHHLQDDVRAILAAGSTWTEPRGFALLLRSVIPQLLAMRQPALAFAALEAGLAAAPAFTPEQEDDAVALIHFALHSGRKRLAATLLGNFSASTFARQPPGAELLALRTSLHNQPPTP